MDCTVCQNTLIRFAFFVVIAQVPTADLLFVNLTSARTYPYPYPHPWSYPYPRFSNAGDNLSHFFTEVISSRGREFSEHFWERDRKRKAL